MGHHASVWGCASPSSRERGPKRAILEVFAQEQLLLSGGARFFPIGESSWGGEGGEERVSRVYVCGLLRSKDENS